MGGQGRQLPILVFEDQVTLSQPEGADCATRKLSNSAASAVC